MKEKELLKDIERDFHRLQKFSLFSSDNWKVCGFSHDIQMWKFLEGMAIRYIRKTDFNPVYPNLVKVGV